MKRKIVIVTAIKNLYLDGTDKKLFTKGREYKIDVSSNYYKDWNVKDDNNFTHEVDKDFINKNFKIDFNNCL